jgi:hypothetical protein
MADTPQQLTAEQFAAKIRAKYPGAYDHLQDQELTTKVLQKYPEYNEKVMAPGVAESRKQQQVSGPIAQSIARYDKSPDAAYSIFQPTGVSTQPKGGQLGGTSEQVGKVRKLQKSVTETSLSMVGGVPGAGVKGVAGVAARVAGAGAGGALGAAASTADQGTKAAFWEAAKTGSLFASGQLVFGEFLPAGWKALSRLWKSDPGLVAQAGDIISTEERTRMVIQEEASKLREAANASYPQLPDVPIMPAARTAQAAEAGAMRTSVEGLPKQVGKLADIGRTRQREALSLLIRAQKVLQQQGATPEVVQILEKARKTGTMPAIDAQQVKSALGRLLSKGNLPGPQYQAVKETYESMVGSIKQVAADAGQLQAYEAAEARVAQWHADFDNAGAPLKQIMEAKPDERGVVLEHLISNPETRVRAAEAMQRNGFNVEEIKRIAAQYRSPTDLRRAIEMAARLEQIGEKPFSAQEAAATRKAVGSKALKAGATAAGGTLLYELYKQLKGKAPSLMP